MRLQPQIWNPWPPICLFT